MAEIIVSAKEQTKHEQLLEKRRKQDLKDKEYDSDDDLKKEMLTYDDRLSYINKIDRQIHGEVEKPKVKEVDKEAGKK